MSCWITNPNAIGALITVLEDSLPVAISSLILKSGTLVDGSTRRADESYLRESILYPAKRVTRGFETRKTGVGMPPYLGVLNEDQVASLILYLKSLR